MQVCLPNGQVMFICEGHQGHRSKKGVKCDPPPTALIESTTATAVMASPFKTFRAWHYLPVGQAVRAHIAAYRHLPARHVTCRHSTQ